MKNIKRIFVLFLASFLLTVSVNASLSCDIRIEETSIDPAGFDVMMPICVYKDYPDHPAGYNEVTDIGAGEDDQLRRRTTYQDAYGSGLEMVNYAYTAETADGKDVYERTGTVPVCATSLRKVVAYSTCNTHLSKAPNIERCSSKDQTTCNNDSRCFWNSTVDTPRCQSRNGNDVISATCDAGYTMTDDGICQKFMTYNYEEEVTNNVNVQTIIDKCKQATGSNYCYCHAPSAVNKIFGSYFGCFCS